MDGGRRKITVTANLSIQIGNDLIKVRGDGSHVMVEVANILRLLRSFNLLIPRGTRVQRLQFLHDQGLTVSIETMRWKWISFGDGEGSAILRYFGFPHTRLHLRSR